MAFLLPLVYQGAVAYISVEISLGLYWCRDILRVKGQALFTNSQIASSELSSANIITIILDFVT